MSFEYIIDAYAWIEYFRGSAAGAKAKHYIEASFSATPTIVLAEPSRKLLREMHAGRETLNGMHACLSYVRSTTVIVPLTEEIAIAAGEIDVERKSKVKNWRLADFYNPRNS